MIKALVFDFDGLITDTETPEYQAWQALYQSYGCELPLAIWSACIGGASTFSPYQYLEERLGQPIDRPTIKARVHQRKAALMADLSTLPGVRDYIADAKRLNLRLALASSSPYSWVSGHLAKLGLLSTFEVIHTADDVEEVKPNPALYQLAVQSLDVRPGEAIALEDSRNGLIAAKGAGLHCVVIPNAVTRHLDFKEADRHLNALSDLPLERLISNF